MGLFGDLFKAAANTAKLPLSIGLDATTLGGLATGREETYTEKNVEQLKKNLEDLEDDLYDDK